MKLTIRTALFALSALTMALAPQAASAQAAGPGCGIYDHNGSTMAVRRSGSQITIHYVRPRDVLARAGVRNGTLLFDGRVNSGLLISGTARVFSRHCPGSPLLYGVEGWTNEINQNIELRGVREVHSRCQPTGRRTQDVLRFDNLGYGC